jgi:protein ImuB
LLADASGALAWWALQFTPMVAQVDGALVLEVSASERLFGGRAALTQRIFKENNPVAPVYYAQGATSLIAIGRLLSGSLSSLPDDLPLQTLAAARTHLPTLERLGCTTWGQLRKLPRGGLVRRFGAELVDALDRAYGQRAEVYPWLTLPEVFDEKLELSAAVESAPALLFGARRLLAQLLVWLRLRQRGVLALELCWELDARRSNALHVDAHHSGNSRGRLELRTAQATQDTLHLQRLLGEQLERVTLPAPVLYLHLRTLQTQALAGESLSLLPEDRRTGDSLHQMLERVSARLGAAQVLCAHPLADHVPERMQQWQPWAGERLQSAQEGTTQTAVDAVLYPSWLLRKPQKLQAIKGVPQYLGALALLCGPQRLESGWLEGVPVLRDYFVARSPVAGLVWVYAERLQGAKGDKAKASQDWYLHGLFA